MEFPKTMKEFIDSYSFKDEEKVYTNGSELMPVFRVEQALEHYKNESRNKAIEEFAEKLKYELNGNIIPDNEKFTYARKQQEQICHQNTTLKRAIKYVDYIAEQLKGEKE